MRDTVRFSCTALAGTGKQGLLPKDTDGYYTMPIGALNTFNSAGDYYPYEEAKELFTSSAPLMRRIKTGCLKGEYGHPKPLPNQSMDSFASRVMQIDEQKTCVHFSDIWLDFDSVKDEMGKPVIAVLAKLTPTGPFGPALQKSLDNPKEDVCFSIRSFTEDIRVNGVRQRNLREIVTYDFVTEPGINVARKYKAPALENFEDVVFTKANIESVALATMGDVALESAAATGRNLIRALGWDFDPKAKPSYFKW
ncbi:MAG: hypothetical protein PHQ58_05175 [Rhodoferax sp.]|uniref:S80 family phage morphogenetic serine protease n=1 Tax=Rhodoferax sp. TaxID=50421 RepID=UPI00262C4519|nr:S80 family phage morphogenetic serine protease [Rhodoferax sp.]MDD2879807.1 hypothetical protein [Rhodoferax sp.]